MEIKTSIIIPLFNKRNTILKTIESVLNQTFSNFELVIVDDGSTDGSGDLVDSLSDNRIRHIKKENGGVSSARNVGIREAKGDFVLFLDADDSLTPSCLETLIRPLTTNDGIDISAANFFREHNGYCEKYSKYSYEGVIPDNFKWLFLGKYSMRAGSFLIKKDLLLKHPFDETLNRFEDKKCILAWIKTASIYYSSSSTVMTYNNDYSELSKVSKDTSKDYIFNISFKNTCFWEKLILGELLFQGLKSYPNYRRKLILQYGFIPLFCAIGAKIIGKSCRHGGK